MYMWDEMVAKHWSSEVASCLRHFFETYWTGAKSLVSYSDSCGGQNKNLTVLGLYSELYQQGVDDIVDRKFLTRGHTFLRNDSDFAQIEKRKSVPWHICPVIGVRLWRRQTFRWYRWNKDSSLIICKQDIEGKYTNRHIVTGGSTYRDVHWLNFGWGLESNPSLNRSVSIHPSEVWMRDTYCSWESWRKEKN